MHRPSVVLGVMLALAACMRPLAQPNLPTPSEPPAERVTVAGREAVTEVDYRFLTTDGQTLVAKLTLPAQTRRPAPVVIFIGGSGSWDSEYSQRLDDQRLRVLIPISTLARRAARSGLAFVRYQKRGATDPGGRITADWKTATLDNLLDDLRVLLAKVKADPRLDGTRIALLGHSEGTMLATWVGASDPSVKAYVFMGMVRRNLREVYRFQLATRNGRTFFALADRTPTDGYLDAAEIAEATRKGLVFKNWHAYDRNRDGRLSRDEYMALMEAYYRDWVRMILSSEPERLVPGNGSPAAWFQQHFRHATVEESWRRLRTPVLVIQGTSDTNTPFKTEAEPFGAFLAANRHPDHRVVGLDGLDHWFQDAGGVSQATRAFDLLLPWLQKRL